MKVLLAIVSLFIAATPVAMAELQLPAPTRRLTFGPQKTCPSVSPLNSTQFDLDRYIEKSWFIQKQQITPYQSENDLYCVVATYNKREDGFLQVINSANQGSVTGPQQNEDPEGAGCFSGICAEQLNAGKLRVGPCFLNFVNFLTSGPYWVLAVADDYSWTIVSGGQTDQFRGTINGTNFCTTTVSDCFLDVNGSGLWLFTRAQIATATQIATMEAKLTEMGVWTGDLLPVTHTNCTYPDFVKI